MPTVAFEYQTDEERLAIEAAIAHVCEMRQLALNAPPGQVLSRCEERALDQGRKLIRSTLQQAVQARIDEAEKKGAAPGPVRAPGRSASNGGVTGR